MAALEVNLGRVHEAGMHNDKALHDSIAGIDVMMQILQRILSDMCGATESGVYLRSDGSIDFHRYIEEFYGVQGFSLFVLALRKWEVDSTAPPPETEAEEETHVVFGGDGDTVSP